MTVYNILFPFLILVALGVAVFIFIRHLSEVPSYPDIHAKEEKKRWWQLFLGKGEGLLRILRIFVLKIDNKLNDSIKNVREKKETIGQNLRDYKEKRRKKEVVFDSKPIEEKERGGEEELLSEEPVIENLENKLPRIDAAEEINEVTNNVSVISAPAKEREPQKPIKKPLRFRFPFQKERPAIEEIVKKTFTPAEIKTETREYWKKKEEMLIQSIVREPRNVSLFLQLGRLYCNQKNWEDARNAFFEVLKLDKTNIKAKEELKRIDKNESRN